MEVGVVLVLVFDAVVFNGAVVVVDFLVVLVSASVVVVVAAAIIIVSPITLPRLIFSSGFPRRFDFLQRRRSKEIFLL